MALVDANYRFLFVDVGCNGRVSDGGVFSNCALSAALQRNVLNIPAPRALPGREKPVPFVVVADDAFPLQINIMKPYPFREQPCAVRVFNYRLSRARRVAENAFGGIATVFRVLRKPLLVRPETAESVVLAICVLHNFLLSQDSESTYTAIDSWCHEGMPNNNVAAVQNIGNDRYGQEPKAIRDELRDFFVTPQGEVPWQYKHI